MNKDTKGKLPLNLVPPRAYKSIATVRDFGNQKYGNPWGWLDDVTVHEFIEATKRHLLEVDLDGSIFVADKESGLLHLEHALTSLAMAVELVKLKEEGK